MVLSVIWDWLKHCPLNNFEIAKKNTVIWSAQWKKESCKVFCHLVLCNFNIRKIGPSGRKSTPSPGFNLWTSHAFLAVVSYSGWKVKRFKRSICVLFAPKSSTGWPHCSTLKGHFLQHCINFPEWIKFLQCISSFAINFSNRISNDLNLKKAAIETCWNMFDALHLISVKWCRPHLRTI